MPNSTRLQVRGYFGQRAFEPFCQNLMADRAWKSAKKRGGISNLDRYGEDEEKARISLSYTTAFPPEWNAKAAWTVQQGGSQYFVAIPSEGFRGSVGGLSFQNGANNAASLFTTSTALVGANTPFTIRFQIAKPDSDQKGAYWYCGWNVWRFEIRNGQASVFRLKPEWTNALETERNNYLKLETMTPTQAARAAEIEALIYADGKSINNVGSEGWYDGAYEISFLPDSRGVFSVVVEGTGSENATDVEDTRITKTRASGTIWPASIFSIGSNGGSYAWQLGRPEYAPSGTFGLGVFNALLGIDSTDIDVTVRGDGNGGTATGECIEHNVAKWEIVLTLTGTGLTSPVVYGAQAFAQGGERQGTDTVLLDTNDFLPTLFIEDIQPSFDEDNRRTSVMVVMRDIEGALSNVGGSVYPGYEQGTAHNFMHDRLTDPIVNSHALVSRGVVTSAVLNNAKTVAASGIGNTFARAETKITLNISDWWYLADEMIMTRQPVGDGMRLGAYLRQLIMMGGWKESEVSGINPNAGITLPVANLGESPCVQPSYGATLGDFLRDLLQKYALGWLLTAYTGTWNFAAQSTAIKARFSKNASWADRTAGTPINRIMNQLDLTRDFTDSYNVFRVMGAMDENGDRLSAVWRIHPAINYAPSPAFVGRVKDYPTIIDDGLRTLSMVKLVARSTAMMHGRLGRCSEFPSWWVDDFHPKDFCQIDAIDWEMMHITGGSSKEDRMSFAAREYVPLIGGFA